MSFRNWTPAMVAAHNAKARSGRIAATAQAILAEPSSHLERRFLLIWAGIGGPELTPQFKWFPGRKFCADFVHLPSKTLIEIEGGAHMGKGHTGGDGFVADAEKHHLAWLRGWTVVRLTAPMLTDEVLTATAMRLTVNTRTP